MQCGWGCNEGRGNVSTGAAWAQAPAPPSPLHSPPRFLHGLTCSTFSSLSSVKTVPSIWLGFSATQLKTGMRNLVWIGFFTFTAG